MQRAECGPWFAQPGILHLAKTKATVWRGGDTTTEEWFDCVSEEGEYMLSKHQPTAASDWQERNKWVWVAGGLPCDRCGPAGELANLILGEGTRWVCPRCGEESLEFLSLSESARPGSKPHTAPAELAAAPPPAGE
jgi:ribosomal protein S27AE